MIEAHYAAVARLLDALEQEMGRLSAAIAQAPEGPTRRELRDEWGYLLRRLSSIATEAVEAHARTSAARLN